jgi:CoA:oxalate CoA-transferase
MIGDYELRARVPLAGVRVLDLSLNLPGPYATLILRSLGAEVIKVEPPKGDPARNVPPLFSIVNRGKKSVVLDLKEERDREAFHGLVARADVLVEGFRPGVMEGFGAGPEVMCERHPRLVYCAISAYGRSGPYASRPAHDLNLQALTGAAHMQRDDEGRPRGVLIPIADLTASVTAVASITTALYARERSGRGAYVDVALADTVHAFAHVWGEGLTPRHLPVASMLKKSAVFDFVDRQKLHALPHYELFETKDGRHLAIGIVDEDKFWRVLAKALGLSLLASLPLPARAAGGPPLQYLVRRAVRKRTLEEWTHLIDPNEVPVCPVLSLEEALSDPQLAMRRGPTGAVGAPYALDGLEDARVPRLGEHGDEVLGASV